MNTKKEEELTMRKRNKEIIKTIKDQQEVENMIDKVVLEEEEKLLKMEQEAIIPGEIIQKELLKILKIIMMIIILKKHLIQKIKRDIPEDKEEITKMKEKREKKKVNTKKMEKKKKKTKNLMKKRK